MDQVDLSLGHPKTGAPCDCTVWINSRHPAQGGASVTWHAVVRTAGQPQQEIGPRSSSLMEGALLLPPETLARVLLEQALG